MIPFFFYWIALQHIKYTQCDQKCILFLPPTLTFPIFCLTINFIVPISIWSKDAHFCHIFLPLLMFSLPHTPLAMWWRCQLFTEYAQISVAHGCCWVVTAQPDTLFLSYICNYMGPSGCILTCGTSGRDMHLFQVRPYKLPDATHHGQFPLLVDRKVMITKVDCEGQDEDLPGSLNKCLRKASPPICSPANYCKINKE